MSCTGEHGRDPESASPKHVGPRLRWDDAGPRAGTRPAAFSPDRPGGRSRTAQAVPGSGTLPGSETTGGMHSNVALSRFTRQATWGYPGDREN